MADLAGQNFQKLTCGKVTLLSSMAHSTASICLWKLHGYVLDFMHLLANTSVGCSHTFGHVVYVGL